MAEMRIGYSMDWGMAGLDVASPSTEEAEQFRTEFFGDGGYREMMSAECFVWVFT
jgi:hypothetical protein